MSGKTELPIVVDTDNPEWTAADFATARPLADFPDLAAAVARTPGRPRGSARSDRQQVTLRLPRHVIDHFRAQGPGWQTRAIAALEQAVVTAREDRS
jgi:uncharacterized protein (DUF4415 family)